MKTGFGWIQISNERYEHDIVMHADHTITKRKKKLLKSEKAPHGHTPLSGAELEFLKDERPEVVYIGTGQYGDLPVTNDATAILEKYKSVVKPTPEILPLIEHEQRRYVAVIHVTC